MPLYRALLHLYPAAFRIEYGDEMCAIFDQRRRDVPSVLAMALLWLETFFDVLSNAFRVHLDILKQDLRYTARTLGRAPGFTFTVIVVAALGVGATTAAFTMVDHVLIRPLPFAQPDRVVKLWQTEGAQGYTNQLSPANYHDWKSMSTSFESMGVYRGLAVNLVGHGDPRHLNGASVSADLLPLLGVQPVLGRLFTPEDDRDTSPGTVLLAYRFWQSAFGADRGILGRTLILDDRPFTIIGVMPENFFFPNRDCDIWTAIRFEPADFEDRTDTYLNPVGRLRPGVSIEQAGSELRLVAAQLERQYPKELARIGARLNRLRDEISGQTRLLLIALFGAAMCVLLIACTNLANLLLARAMSRRKEMSVRAAMGAGRERLVRQLLTESLILAICGGALGMLLAFASLPLLVRLVPNGLPVAGVPSMDIRVLLFAALSTITAGVGFGVLPALRVSHGAGLREGSRSGVGGRKERLRSVLVVVEVAGCVVLLVSSGLLIRALWRIQSTSAGFRPENVLTLRTALPMPKYENPRRRGQFYARVLGEIRDLPGTTAAGYTSFLPMVNKGGLWPVIVKERPAAPGELPKASLRFITPGFFAAMGIPVELGRDFSEADTHDAPFVAVVSESMVRRFWPGENPIGRTFEFGNGVRTIVGVVGDVRVRGLERTSEPQVYLSYKQSVRVSEWYSPKDLVVRSSADFATLAAALRRIIQNADPRQPVADVRPLTSIVEAETAPRAIQVRVLGAFAAVAFLLAAIGIYGLLSFAVSHRTQEIGVRIALGARSGDILSMVAREGLALAVVGTVAGIALAYGAGRWMQSLLAGVNPADLPTFASAMALAMVMTVGGCLWPALRAARVDPVTAIRAE